MLEEYKKIYEAKASIIPQWNKMSKNQLCNKYIENCDNSNLAECYLSAIICKYWPSIDKMYFLSSGLASEEDCYEWIIRSILYALEHRRWLDKDSSIYGDANGPDKIINRAIRSARLTYFQALNRDKRKSVLNEMSLEGMQESGADNHLPVAPFEEVNLVEYLVKKYYTKKDYFVSFLIDCICHEECFVLGANGSYTFQIKKLSKLLRNIDKNYCLVFAERYKYSLDDVIRSSEYVTCIPSTRMTRKIQASLEKLKHSEDFKS